MNSNTKVKQDALLPKGGLTLMDDVMHIFSQNDPNIQILAGYNISGNNKPGAGVARVYLSIKEVNKIEFNYFVAYKHRLHRCKTIGEVRRVIKHYRQWWNLSNLN